MQARIQETGELVNVIPIRYVEFGSKTFGQEPRSFNAHEIVLETDIVFIGESFNDLCLRDISERVSDAVCNEMRRKLMQTFEEEE